MTPSPDRPRFSLVCAVGGDEDRVGGLLDSISALTFDATRVEVVLVLDAGDEAPSARTWAEQAAGPVLLVEHTDGSRLATGLAAATGEWVGFPSAVDALAPRYLSAFDKFLTAHPDADAVVGNQLVWDAASDELTRAHPLRAMFAENVLVDLTAPRPYFAESGIAALVPRDRVSPDAFAPGAGPTFETGYFLAHHLLGSERPQVGFVRTARYQRRKPGTGAPSRESTFGSVPEPTRLVAAYADLVARARAVRGHVPDWLRRQLSFEVGRYLDSVIDVPAVALPEGEDADVLLDAIAALVADADLVGTIDAARFFVSRQTKNASRVGFDDLDWVDGQVTLDRRDTRLGLVRARYYYRGAEAEEVVRHGSSPVAVEWTTRRSIEFLGRPLLRERVLWVPAAEDLAIELGGTPARLVDAMPPVDAPDPEPQTAEGRRAQKEARSRWRTREFRDAWVFTDKVHAAGDNAEHLFTHVRAHHREINAFFVVEAGTESFARLSTVHGRRVVAHGSHRWRVLMACCTEYVSSHCDTAITHPPALLDFLTPRWRFSMINHGVRKDDSSPWLNKRPLDMLVTTTPAETEFLTGDDSNYVFTGKEVVESGLPRLDRLLELGRSVAPADRRLLLVAPTWRNWLVPGLAGDGQRRSLAEGALDSEYVARWTGLLADRDLAALCERHGLELTLLPHPNLEALLGHLDLPDHVRTAAYAGTGIQELFARTRLLVTDYSSVAFDLAYLDRPVVYFQFDHDEFTSGRHTFQPGYFDQREHGFGPATATHAEAVAAIVASVEAGPDPVAPYDARIATTFPVRDGGCCERTLAGIRGARD